MESFFNIRNTLIYQCLRLRDNISTFTFTALNEVGIYRVSGVTSDVQHLKKMFDKSKYETRTIFKKDKRQRLRELLSWD